MRTLCAAALSCMVGACVLFGGGGFDPYGIYDVVTANGEDWTENDDFSGWWELRSDGTSTLTINVAMQPEPEHHEVEFSLGEIEDGCFPFTVPDQNEEEWSASICGDVFTIQGPGQDMVLHKRR